MIVTYLRSSSIGTYAMCPMKYYCTYVLGMKDKDNGKAIIGSVVHKNLELLGRYKLAMQAKKHSFVDEEFGKITFKQVSIEYFNDLSHKYYEDAFPGIMPANSKKIALQWTHLALTRLDGEMDPRNQDIHAVEEFFEVEVPHEWADYEYLVGDQVIKGRLGLKGTVDLITREGEFHFHIQDYKTGRRYDWAKEQVKEYKDLAEDKQLYLYYYALRLKYPDHKFYVSIFYINDHPIDGVVVPGGLFTFAFDDIDFKKAESMIKKEFETIKANKSPSVISQKCAHFKCRFMCNYSQIIPEISSKKPACIALREEIAESGIDAVTLKYANLKKMTAYSGGGRLDVQLATLDGQV